MTECKHEWRFYEESKDGCFCCVRDCYGRLSRAEAETLINATSAMSAEIANRIHFADYDDEDDPNIANDYVAIKAYANAPDDK